MRLNRHVSIGSPLGAPIIIGKQKIIQIAMIPQAVKNLGQNAMFATITNKYDKELMSFLAKAEYFSLVVWSTLLWWRT